MSCNHTEGRKHDCAYVEARNRLIPAAIRATVKELGRSEPGLTATKPQRVEWGAVFLRHMQRLWKQGGTVIELIPRVESRA